MPAEVASQKIGPDASDMPRLAPPEYGYKQEGPVQFQWVTRRAARGGDSFLEGNR